MRRLLFALFCIIIFLPLKVSEACGPYDNSFYGYSFWNSQIVAEKSEYAPYFLTFSDMSAYYEQVQEVKQADNLEEWRIKVCESATPAEIAQVVYKSSLTELEVLRTVTSTEQRNPSGRLKANAFADYLNSGACTETMDYLVFAKQCEPHVLPIDPWNDDTRDYATMQDLLREGQKRFRKTKSHFLKLRYAYQIIRLAHYRKDYKQVLELYDFLMPKIDEVLVNGLRSLMYWWILGHKAGALLRLGDRTEAAYLYSRIFAECPSKRESAFRSFSVKNQEEWDAVLKRCQSNKERSVIYALRANASDSRAIADMETIYRLNPESRHLEVLLVKEIKELEEDLLGLEWNKRARRNKRLYNVPRAVAGDYVIELQEFARRLRIEEKVAHPELWYLAEGYLEFLAGDNYAARQTFLELRPRLEDEQLQKQMQSFELALQIADFDQVRDETEEAAYNILKDSEEYKENESFPRYLRDRMAALYKKRKKPGKAFRSQFGLDDLRPNPKEEVVNELLEICLDKDRNDFERLLVENNEGDPITNELWDMKAVLALQEYQLEAALLAMKKIPRTEWDNFGRFDVFRPTVKDCISCEHSKDSIDLFNRGNLIIELLELESEARAEPEKAPLNYFKIGTALYNMTYFGHSWNARDYYRSGSTWSKMRIEDDDVFRIPGEGYPFGNKELLNTSRALFYFEKCRILSESEELSAQATFMAAKCELAQYYLSDDYRKTGRNQIPNIPEAYSKNYKILKEQLNDTQFYAQIIEECLFFRVYASK